LKIVDVSFGSKWAVPFSFKQVVSLVRWVYNWQMIIQTTDATISRHECPEE
jgi:hypothetical protein